MGQATSKTQSLLGRSRAVLPVSPRTGTELFSQHVFFLLLLLLLDTNSHPAPCSI